MATFLALTYEQSGEPGLRNVRARQRVFFFFFKFSKVWLQIPSPKPGGDSEEHKAYEFQIWKADVMTEQLFSHQIRAPIRDGREVERLGSEKRTPAP